MAGSACIALSVLIGCSSSEPKPETSKNRSAEAIGIVNRSYVRNQNPTWKYAVLNNARETAYQYDVYPQCQGQCWVVSRTVPLFINGETKNVEFEWAVMPDFKTADPNNPATEAMYTRICTTGC
jgi:hypothetical protein